VSAPEHHYYVCDPAGTQLFGAPPPEVGVRTVFDPARLAAYGSGSQLPLVHRARGPQGLVVFATPLDAQTWPCRLWRVGDLREPVRPWRNSWYLRCASFVVGNEVPAWRVFGGHGRAVADVVDRARRLTPDEVSVLAAAAGEAEEAEQAALRAVMRRWRVRTESTPHRGRLSSPVGYGLTATRTAVEEAAARTGSHLFDWVDEAVDTPVLADPAWRSARHAAAAAALLCGAPELASTDEAAALRRRWRMIGVV
jgi:hypothetical protein